MLERLLRESRLPLEKNLATFDLKRLPAEANPGRRSTLLMQVTSWTARRTYWPSARQVRVRRICTAQSRKSWCGKAGQGQYFQRCRLLVQELLQAKQELRLSPGC